MLITSSSNPVDLISWDFGKQLQNTIVFFRTDGRISAFQLSPFGLFTGVTVATSGIEQLFFCNFVREEDQACSMVRY
ncbi:hypothetical protein [Planctomycetes bacterium Poly30]